jgi:hypothetical protein
MSYVLPVRKGGLGNQMFQVAAAMVYSKATGRTILLPKEFYNHHNTNNLDYGESLFREFIHRIDKPVDGNAIQALLYQGFVQYPGEPGFEDWQPLDLSGHVLLHGYFQTYPPLEPYEQILRTVYLSGLGNFRIQMRDAKDRVGIHIRRGDYLKPPHSNVLPAQPLEYYKEALKRFPETSEFYIFSDDQEWCQQQTIFQELPKKVFIQEANEVKTLAIMTTCRGGFICANSTFSWWGAFLGAYGERAPVIVPSNWCIGGVGNLFPKEWIVL